MKKPIRLWLVVLLLGWAFDFLFWKHTPGISFVIYVALCLIGGFVVLGAEGLKPSWKALPLLVPIIFFATMTFVRQEPMSVFLSAVFTLFLLAVLASTYLGGRWPLYGFSDYIANTFRLAGSMVARPFIVAIENRKQTPSEGKSGDAADSTKRQGLKQFWSVLRGVLIALPIVAIFATLLASADLVFAQKLSDFVAIFRLERLPEYIFRAVYIIILAYFLAGAILHAAMKSKDEKLLGVEQPLVPPFLGFTEAAVVLTALVVLFAVFVAIQFQYFFGGQVNIHIEGYTYAEYARRGFSELVAVAFFSLLLFLGLSAVVRRGTTAQRWSFSGLGIALVLLVGVMLVSAFQRLLLYEAAYGFSRLRTYTHVFMIWLGVLLIVAVVLEILRRERAFALAMLLASIGFIATLTLLNVDGFIVHQNVKRAVQGEELDISYLTSLSTDAIPVLVEVYQSPSLPIETHEAVGASLACLRADFENRREDTNWRAFNLSRSASTDALKTIEDDLDDYRIVGDDWPSEVITPQGQEYQCWVSWD